MNKKLILFDLDGVLLDSERNMELSWLAVCEQYGIDVKFENYFSYIGRPFEDILNILNIKERQSSIEKTFNEVSTQLIHKVSFYNGVDSVLSHLSNMNIKTGIVTSKNAIKTQKILKLLNFSFDIVQTPNNDLQGKPAPDHLLYAMSELNISASNTLYIGDMDVDYEAAKDAKVDYFHALWGYGTCPDKNTIKLKQISDLMDFIK